MTARGGDFSFSDGSRVTGPGLWRLESGNMTMTGAVSFSNLVLTGGQVNGTHTIDGLVRWQQANFNANGTTTIAASATLVLEDANSNHDHFGRTIRNEGTVRWTGGDVRGGEASGVRSRIVNAGLWQDEGTGSRNVSSFNTALPLTFENTGTYLKASSGATTNFRGYRMDNSGTVEAAAGTLHFEAGVAQVVGNRLTGGTWVAGPDALILIPGISPITINEGSVHLRGPNSRMSGISTLADNRGEFRISEGRNFATANSLASVGLLAVGVGSKLTASGNFSLLSGGALEIDISAPGAGIGHGTVEARGSATLAGRLQVDLLTAIPSLATTTFTLLTAANVQGEFAGLPDGARFDANGIGGSFVIDYTSTGVYLNNYVAAVPEPGTWAMMGIGALLIGWRASRRRVVVAQAAA